MNYVQAKEYARNMRKNPTEAEARLWESLRRRQVAAAKFNRQFVIQHYSSQEKGDFFIVDFYCAEVKLIIEVDGSIHDEQVDYDEARTAILESLGYSVIRFSNTDVHKAHTCILEKIEKVLSILRERI